MTRRHRLPRPARRQRHARQVSQQVDGSAAAPRCRQARQTAIDAPAIRHGERPLRASPPPALWGKARRGARAAAGRTGGGAALKRWKACRRHGDTPRGGRTWGAGDVLFRVRLSGRRTAGRRSRRQVAGGNRAKRRWRDATAAAPAGAPANIQE